MKKIIADINLNYTYNANHANAHYTFDGIHYMNGGDLAECIDKQVRGYEPKKDANVPFDKDSDIPELKLSVKSQRCGLTDRRLADNLQDYIKIFFEKVHSDLFDWVVIIDDKVIIYTMTKKEFRQFVKNFCKWDKHSAKPRFGITSIKMLKWLDARAK